MKHTAHSSLTIFVLGMVVFSPLAHAQEVVAEQTPVVAPVQTDAPVAPILAEETPPEPAPDVAPVLPDEVVVVSDVPTEEEVAPQESVPATEEPPVVIQDTAPAQDAIGGELLESTVNPETATSTTAEVLEVDAASSTPDTIPVVEESVPSEEEVLPLEESVILETVSDIPADTTVPTVEVRMDAVPDLVIAQVEIDSGPEFAFSLSSKSIPAKRNVRDEDGEVDSVVSVSEALVPQIDNAKGEISFAGACSDAYFVVLLFKNQNDYDDPSSYILNKAYPCEGGRYAYSITDLPVNLQSGLYYLLVGQQGERGAWVPITGLAEITINKN